MASNPLQNRLVGTVIVVALAVIVLPDLFGNAGQVQQDEFQITPLSPVVDSQMKSPNFPADFAVMDTTAGTNVVVPIQDEVGAHLHLDEGFSVPDLAPTLDLGRETVIESTSTKATGERWVIQLGAFRNYATVETLLAQLREAGFSADSRELRRPEGRLHLLLVGPDLSEKKLANQLKPLKELTNLDGKVVPYRPAHN